MQGKIPRQIIIVGGGTAGWMAANLMAHQWRTLGIGITLIESSDIGTVGVGEGSTPFLKAFFQTLGIAEQQWMPACNATYKCGINFPDWSTVPGHSSYFHPFYGDPDAPQARLFFQNCADRRQGIDAPAIPDEYFIATHLTRQKQAPIAPATDQAANCPALDYGYHFDSELLGRFLKKHAIGLGVRHIDDTVTKVHQDGAGNIAIVQTALHGPLRGDFFVDCSGFNGLLIHQTLGEQLISYRDQLFNDSAVAISTPLPEQDKIPCHTESKALKHGWVWHIPLQNRYGNGYVYSSDYINKSEAEAELRALLGEAADGQAARHLHWQPGRISNHWKHNCVAIGLSQGFLEPLEAPMLYLIQRSIENFIERFVAGGFGPQQRQRFNDEINTIIDGTRDYLQAHYKLNSRNDSRYWTDNAANERLSGPLEALLNGWRGNDNFDQVLGTCQSQLSYQKTSWYCLLAGKGYFPAPQQASGPVQQQRIEQARQTSRDIAAGYMDHFSALQQINLNQ